MAATVKPKKVYGIQITLDPEHVGPVLEALDLYFRVSMGQLSEIGQLFWSRQGLDDEIKEHLNAIKAKLFPELKGSPNANFSIGSSETPEAAKIACEIHDLIRRADAYARMPEGPKAHGPSVIFDTPLKLSKVLYPRVRTLGLLELLADAAQDDPEPGKKKLKKAKKSGKAS